MYKVMLIGVVNHLPQIVMFFYLVKFKYNVLSKHQYAKMIYILCPQMDLRNISQIFWSFYVHLFVFSKINL